MNKCIFMGNLTRNPETKYCKTKKNENMCICKFTVAVNNGEDVCYPQVTAFGKLGEVIDKYFKKGMPILVTTHLQQNVVEDKGEKKTYSNYILDEFNFCGSKKE